jgi:hypothetical protein
MCTEVSVLVSQLKQSKQQVVALEDRLQKAEQAQKIGDRQLKGWQALLGQKEEIYKKTQGQDMETSQLKETVRRQKEQLKQIFNEMS